MTKYNSTEYETDNRGLTETVIIINKDLQVEVDPTELFINALENANHPLANRLINDVKHVTQLL